MKEGRERDPERLIREPVKAVSNVIMNFESFSRRVTFAAWVERQAGMCLEALDVKLSSQRWV